MNTALEKPNPLREYLTAARHRRKTLILVFSLGLLFTVLLAVFLPPKYRSSGTILIEQQEMPQELVRSTVTSYADERVQVISKRVMTTETLLNIIRRYDLYPQERAKDTREALLGRMRKDIGLKMISADVIDPRSGRPTAATIAFEVSYISRQADLAAKVANEITTLYLNENLNNRTQLARDAATFLESEGDRINRQIAELEVKLADFKDKNLQKLPELTQLNMQLLDRTGEELRGAQNRKDSLEQQRVYLEAQLAQLKPNSTVFSDTGERIVSSADRLKMARSQLDSARATYAPDHPDVVRLQREVDGLQKGVAAAGGPKSTAPSTELNDLRRRLESARSLLADARERYSPEHPDRIRLERQVADLEAQLAAEPLAAPVVSADPPNAVPIEADNPAFVQIQAQLSATRNDIAALAGEMAKLRAQADEYQRNISLSPQVEKQYRELSRDYDNARLKYAEIRSKQVEAKTAQNLEADRKGERFTLIDPPLPPEEPISPNRLLIFIAGTVLSIGLVAGVLWYLETMDSTVRGRRDLFDLTGIAPLALVPHIGTLAEARAARRRLWLTTGTSVATLCVAVVLIHFFYRPLDVLWFSFAHRFGF
ncbi:MAG: lipopolysaccharide biosynthesis protein [Gammaproteobacteria bacterium]|nr:lipopolysaccharide biosynthesis protein [Gammaproteobacteria bacterium]